MAHSHFAEDDMKKSNRGWLAAFLLLPILLAMATAPSTASGQETHRLSGADVAIFNLAGTVEIVPGSGGDVVVEVMRGGADASRLEVRTLRVDDREALVVMYPEDRIVYPALGRGSSTETKVAGNGTFFGDWASGGRDVTVAGSGGGMEAWADLRIAVPPGKDFALFLVAGETDLRDVKGDFLIDQGSGGVNVRGAGGVIMIDTGSGDVMVDGFDGDLSVDTGSGGVELNDVQGDKVRVDTGSGAVSASQIRAASVEVDTGSGKVELRGMSCPDLLVDTGSGSVEVELLTDVDRLVVDTGSGGVTIWAPASLGAQVEMDTGSGKIEVDLPLEVREAERDYLRGVIGDGRGSIHIDTGSGVIRIIGR
jgi:lia operon protein LiaG